MISAEFRLFRAEIDEKIGAAAKAGGMLGIAAVTGLLAGACFVTACIAALAMVMPVWLAALLMGILLGLMAAGSFVLGRTRLTEVDVRPQQTIETLKGDVKWARNLTH